MVAHLTARPMRYSELRRAIPQLSEKVLAETLRELESLGVVDKGVFACGAKAATLYSLTAKGQAMGPMLRLACAWARAHASEYGVDFLHGPPCAPNALQTEFDKLIAEAAGPQMIGARALAERARCVTRQVA